MRPDLRTVRYRCSGPPLGHGSRETGFTAPKGSRKHLGAVVIGPYREGKLRHYGYARSGFTEKGLKEAVEKMKPLVNFSGLPIGGLSQKLFFLSGTNSHGLFLL